MKILRFIFFPFAIVYGVITVIRNGFYSLGIFRSSTFSLPIINVGNLSVGGTGKTPHTEYLIRLLKDEHKLVTLSRGFGRKERGFILAKEDASARQIGDEPYQYYRKFGKDIHVAVDANRVTGVMDVCRNLPETELILLDDAYQHRAVKPGFNILVTTYKNPYYSDFILPVGNLREFRHGKKRADIIMVSKCPDFDSIDRQAILNKIAPEAHQQVFFSRFKYSQVVSLNDGEERDIKGRKVILVTGIAQPDPLMEFVSQSTQVLHHFKFNDHYNFKPADLDKIHNLFDKFVDEKPIVLTTEKDAMRLFEPTLFAKLKEYDWCFQSVEIEIDENIEFNKRIKQYVEKNSRNY